MKHIIAKATKLMKLKQHGLLFHSQHVMHLVGQVIEQAPQLTSGYTKSDIMAAAFLHDIGKIEWLGAWFVAPMRHLLESHIEQMRQHPIRSAAIAARFGAPENIIRLIIEHHERSDSRGYPRGVIPHPASLLIATCDVYAACRETRPYRPRPLTVKEALIEAEKVGCQPAADALKNLSLDEEDLLAHAGGLSMH